MILYSLPLLGSVCSQLWKGDHYSSQCSRGLFLWQEPPTFPVVCRRHRRAAGQSRSKGCSLRRDDVSSALHAQKCPVSAQISLCQSTPSSSDFSFPISRLPELPKETPPSTLRRPAKHLPVQVYHHHHHPLQLKLNQNSAMHLLQAHHHTVTRPSPSSPNSILLHHRHPHRRLPQIPISIPQLIKKQDMLHLQARLPPPSSSRSPPPNIDDAIQEQERSFNEPPNPDNLPPMYTPAPTVREGESTVQ